MKKLDLSLNPLGEAGARSVFRTILRGLQCFVIMRGCSYSERKNIFNNSYPGMDSPYTLDLSQPYNYAVLHELLTKVHEQPKACRMESITYHDTATNCNYNLSIKKGKLVNSNNDEFVPTTTGVIKFAFHQTVFIPTTDNIINEESLNILQVIIENGRTEGDRKQWLSLLCQDLYFTTAQAQSTISRFQNNKTIGEGGLTKLDILKSLWNILVDTENMFEFLCNNADREKRKELVFALSFKRYKFNWVNPTGYWNFNLSDKIQRSVMLQLIAINNSEAEYSRYRAGRGDTSQNGNWFNFRNEKYTTVHGITNEIRIDKDFIMNLPADGNIAFDYVSTRRPKLHNKGSRTPRYNYLEKYELLAELSNYQSIDTSTRVNDTNTVANNENSKVQFDTILNTIANAKNNLSDTNLADKVYQSMTPFSSTANSDRGNISDRSNPTSARRGITIDTSDNEEDIIEAPLITDDEFYTLMENLGLSTRYKTNSSNALYVLMDLQLASTRYYFSVENILSILDHFTDEVDIQAKVVVTMFSRIYDLYRLDIVLRSIEPKAQQEVVRRLGYLNVINPLCISFDYIFSLKYLDNRILLIELMQLASFESADNIIEHPKTELPIATLYGAYTRALNETRPETMRFTYCDFGERTINVAWATRKELLKKFLIGTTPIDRNIFKLINMYRELEYNHALSRGPIDVQYADFIKNLRSKTAHAIKANNKMVHAMKSLSVGNTSILSSNIPKITETDTDPDSAIDTSTNGGTTMKARRSFG